MNSKMTKKSAAEKKWCRCIGFQKVSELSHTVDIVIRNHGFIPTIRNIQPDTIEESSIGPFPKELFRICRYPRFSFKYMLLNCMYTENKPFLQKIIHFNH